MEEPEPWLRLVIQTAEPGADAAALGRLLESVANCFGQAARARLGRARVGRAPKEVEQLATVRVVSVTPGSVAVAFRPSALQLRLDEVTPDLLAEDILGELEAASASEPPSPRTKPFRPAVTALLENIWSVGSTAELTHAPASGQKRTVRVSASGPAETLAAETHRSVTLYGHAYMVDVEDGRQRVRIKVHGDADVTMAMDPALAKEAQAFLDRPVRLVADEWRAGGRLVKRAAQHIEALRDDEMGPETPPKSLATLAREQRLGRVDADEYVRLATALWPTAEDIADFEDYLRRSRAASE